MWCLYWTGARQLFILIPNVKIYRNPFISFVDETCGLKHKLTGPPFYVFTLSNLQKEHIKTLYDKTEYFGLLTTVYIPIYYRLKRFPLIHRMT